MSDHDHMHQTIRVRILRGTDGSKKIAWPSLDGGSPSASPIALPSEPEVELLQQPDGKSKIVITCSCGKRIELICEV